MGKDVYHSIIYDSKKLEIVYISNKELKNNKKCYGNNGTVSSLDIHMDIHMDTYKYLHLDPFSL